MLSFNIIKDYKVVEKKIIFQLDYEWSLKINFFEATSKLMGSFQRKKLRLYFDLKLDYGCG